MNGGEDDDQNDEVTEPSLDNNEQPGLDFVDITDEVNPVNVP